MFFAVLVRQFNAKKHMGRAVLAQLILAGLLEAVAAFAQLLRVCNLQHNGWLVVKFVAKGRMSRDNAVIRVPDALLIGNGLAGFWFGLVGLELAFQSQISFGAPAEMTVALSAFGPLDSTNCPEAFLQVSASKHDNRVVL